LHFFLQAQFADSDRAGAIDTARRALALLPPGSPERREVETNLAAFQSAKRH
jgi:hypothetical protein